MPKILCSVLLAMLLGTTLSAQISKQIAWCSFSFPPFTALYTVKEEGGKGDQAILTVKTSAPLQWKKSPQTTRHFATQTDQQLIDIPEKISAPQSALFQRLHSISYTHRGCNCLKETRLHSTETEQKECCTHLQNFCKREYCCREHCLYSSNPECFCREDVGLLASDFSSTNGYMAFNPAAGGLLASPQTAEESSFTKIKVDEPSIYLLLIGMSLAAVGVRGWRYSSSKNL